LNQWRGVYMLFGSKNDGSWFTKTLPTTVLYLLARMATPSDFSLPTLLFSQINETHEMSPAADLTLVEC